MNEKTFVFLSMAGLVAVVAGVLLLFLELHNAPPYIVATNAIITGSLLIIYLEQLYANHEEVGEQ